MCGLYMYVKNIGTLIGNEKIDFKNDAHLNPP